ncbi:unnamed protein product [Thlaspi arvense]|uniref:Reverse transcriptase zinc-binding domain-containing protein n=1 Tax=Thlaspi arvense TaxID=13288 RepID=A0AAU9RD76_THLAR|nr:unnamed protein product [Thlaspi arvense]
MNCVRRICDIRCVVFGNEEKVECNPRELGPCLPAVLTGVKPLTQCCEQESKIKNSLPSLHRRPASRRLTRISLMTKKKKKVLRSMPPDTTKFSRVSAQARSVVAFEKKSLSDNAFAGSCDLSLETLHIQKVGNLPRNSVALGTGTLTDPGNSSQSQIVLPVAPVADSCPRFVAGQKDITPVKSGLPVANSSRPVRKWSSIITDSSQLEEIGTPSQHVSGVPFVLIPDANLEAAKDEFKDFIFARFHGDAPEMGRIIGVVNALWARTGPRIFVHKIGHGTFLLRVINDRTREILLSRTVWNIAGFPMFVAAWSPDLNPEQLPLTSAVVPVEFREVPYLLFNKESLSRIATAVGKPVSLAPETERKETFEVAKVYVRVDLTKELPSKIISGFSNGREAHISVTYPWLPLKCEGCGLFGHSKSRCHDGPSALNQVRTLSTSPSRGKRARPGRSKSRKRQTSTTGTTGSSNSRTNEKDGTVTDLLDGNRASSDDNADADAEQTPGVVEHANEQEKARVLDKEGISTTVEKKDAASSSTEVGNKVSEVSEVSEAAEAPFFLVRNKKSGRLNSDRRHSMTKDWINIHRSLFGAFYETHIQRVNAGRIARAIPTGWNFFGNFDHHETARIAVVWDPSVSVFVYQSSAQAVTCGIFIQAQNVNLTITFVYGHNGTDLRRTLWDELHTLNAVTPVSRTPWAVLGDFNQIRQSSQHSNSQQTHIDTSGMEDFNLALQDAELFEAQTKGLPFTWWNNQEDNPISKKIDHAFINCHWSIAFPDAYAVFMEPVQSDHAACLFQMPSLHRKASKPFKFFHHTADHPQFGELVAEAWSYGDISGSNQLKLAKALKLLKPVLRKLNKRQFSGVSERVRDQAEFVLNLQRMLLTSPTPELAIEEHQARAKWQMLLKAEGKFYRQRSRVKWLCEGDRDTAFYHRTVNQRLTQNHIHFLRYNDNRMIGDTEEIKAYAAEYFQGSMWVAWLNKNVFHRKSFWESDDSARFSPPIRSMLRLKQVLPEFMKCDVRNGISAYFWYDCWTDLGPLLNFMGERGPRQLQIPLRARVAQAAMNGSWRLPAARSEEALQIQISLTTLPPPLQTRGSDIFLWRNSASTFGNGFSAKATWEKLRVPSPAVQWHTVVWFKELIPRCALITWLVLLTRLPTKDRLIRWGMSVPGSCVLCHTGIESHDHLFFSCPFSSGIWKRFASSFWRSPSVDLTTVVSLITSLPPPKIPIAKLCFQITIYLLWKERNARIFTSVEMPASTIAAAVDRMLRDRLLSIPATSVGSPSLLEDYFRCVSFP